MILLKPLLDLPRATPRHAFAFQTTVVGVLDDPARQLAVHADHRHVLAARGPRWQAQHGESIATASSGHSPAHAQQRAKVISSVTNVDNAIEGFPAAVTFHEGVELVT